MEATGPECCVDTAPHAYFFYLYWLIYLCKVRSIHHNVFDITTPPMMTVSVIFLCPYKKGKTIWGLFFSFFPLICRYLRGSLIPCFYSIYHIQPGGAVFLSLIQCEQIMHHIQHATLLYHNPDPHLVWVQKTSVSYDTARSGFHLMLDIKLCIGGV